MSAGSESSNAVTEFFRTEGLRRRVGGGSYLFHHGDEPASVYYVESGLLSIERTTGRGRRVLFDVATPGDVVGELAVVDDTPRSGAATALDESQVLVVGAREFRHHLRADPEFAYVVLESVVGRLRELSDQFVEATSSSAASRIAARLLKLAAGEGHVARSFDLNLPFSQEALAQWAGLSREGAVKGLAELRDAAMIETGRRRILVLDVDGLRQVAARSTG